MGKQSKLAIKVEHVEVKRKTPSWANKFVSGKYIKNNKGKYDSGLIIDYKA